MLVRRKDHACALVQIDNERGILVSGGVDNEDNLLDSVEFYNLATQAWEEISALKNARTEHGKPFWSFVMMGHDATRLYSRAVPSPIQNNNKVVF